VQTKHSDIHTAAVSKTSLVKKALLQTLQTSNERKRYYEIIPHAEPQAVDDGVALHDIADVLARTLARYAQPDRTRPEPVRVLNDLELFDISQYADRLKIGDKLKAAHLLEPSSDVKLRRWVAVIAKGMGDKDWVQMFEDLGVDPEEAAMRADLFLQEVVGQMRSREHPDREDEQILNGIALNYYHANQVLINYFQGNVPTMLAQFRGKKEDHVELGQIKSVEKYAVRLETLLTFILLIADLGKEGCPLLYDMIPEKSIELAGELREELKRRNRDARDEDEDILGAEDVQVGSLRDKRALLS